MSTAPPPITPEQTNIASQGNIPPTALSTSSTTASSGNSSDSAISKIDPYVSAVVGGSAQADAGLLNDPQTASQMAMAIQGYESPYLAQLKAAFGNAKTTAKDLDVGLTGYDLPSNITNTIKSSNAQMAKTLGQYAGDLQSQISNFIPGSIDSEVLGAYSAGMKYYMEGGLTSQQLEGMPGLQNDPAAMGIAQYMRNFFNGGLPGTVPTGPPAPPTGQGVPDYYNGSGSNEASSGDPNAPSGHAYWFH